MYLKGAQIDPHNLLTEWKGREGKFVRTFGINDTRNNNEWRSTWQGVLDNIEKSLGRPGIEYEKCTEAGCGLDHVEAESLEENYEKQKPFEVTNMIDYVIDDDTHTVDIIHEVHDDDFWQKLKNGLIKYVSPMIWPNNGGAESNGIGRANQPITDTWDYEWVHMAFLEKDPAFGDVANVKTTCEGKNCGIQLLSAKQIMADTFENIDCKEKYATIKDGSVKVDWRGDQHQLLHVRNLPHSHVCIKQNGEKSIQRWPNTKSLRSKEKNEMCGNCKFFVENNTCKLVKGDIHYEDTCDLHSFGKTNSRDTKVNPKFEKEEVNYRLSLSGTLADPSTTTLTPLKEVPLLVRHKKKLHLVSASACVQEIIKKKKEAGIKIDDQALAIAFSECGESAGLKSSFKTCTCEEKRNMPDTEQQLVELKSKYEDMEKNHKELEAKHKAQEEKEEERKKGKRARYAKMFATTHTEEEEEKMMKAIKATEDEEDMKVAKEEYENHKTARKAQDDDPEKKELMDANKAMQAKLAEPMINGLIALRRNKLSESELTTYETSLKAKSFVDIQTAYANEKYLMPQPDSLSASTDSNMAFPGEQNGHALSAKSIDDILEEGN